MYLYVIALRQLNFGTFIPFRQEEDYAAKQREAQNGSYLRSHEGTSGWASRVHHISALLGKPFPETVTESSLLLPTNSQDGTEQAQLSLATLEARYPTRCQ